MVRNKSIDGHLGSTSDFAPSQSSVRLIRKSLVRQHAEVKGLQPPLRSQRLPKTWVTAMTPRIMSNDVPRNLVVGTALGCDRDLEGPGRTCGSPSCLMDQIQQRRGFGGVKWKFLELVVNSVVVDNLNLHSSFSEIGLHRCTTACSPWLFVQHTCRTPAIL